MLPCKMTGSICGGLVALFGFLSGCCLFRADGAKWARSTLVGVVTSGVKERTLKPPAVASVDKQKLTPSVSFADS